MTDALGLSSEGKFTKKMDNKKPTYEQICDPAYRRAELTSEKMGAVWVAFNELDGLINKTQLARQYFHRSQGWLSQKLNGCEVCSRQRAFTEEEYRQLADAMRDIARRLNAYAAEIDAAAYDPE